MKTILLITFLSMAGWLSGLAAPLTESTFTEIINEVNTLSADGNASPARMAEILRSPERVRTGPQSRAELTAPDQTITRVGANTVFAYADNGRTLNLEQGNVLFHAPKGLGGGTIKSGGAAAAVLGTTLIVSATTGGGFKVILLEGRGRVTLPNGNAATLTAGQLVLVLPGGALSPVLNINLGKLVDSSLLVKGFSHGLSSLPLIVHSIQQQDSLLKSGTALDTGLSPGNYLNPPTPGNGFNSLTPGNYQIAVPQPLSPNQYNRAVSGTVGTQPGAPAGTGGRGIVITTGQVG